VADKPREHEKVYSPETLVIGLLMAALAAIISMQIISRIGITPNTSIIGAIVAMSIARIPLAFLTRFRSLERQNLIQTMTSAGGFAAANLGLLAVAIIFLIGRTDLIYPMLIGALVAGAIDIILVYKIYDSDLYPATNAWPPGVAAAQAILAGDVGGQRAKRLIQGVVVGAIGTHFGLPMAGIGIVFIANIFAIASLGVGLIVRGYSAEVFGLYVGDTFIPHGFMIGAGLVALVQAIVIIIRGRKEELRKRREREESGIEEEHYEGKPTVTPEEVRKSLVHHLGLFLAGAALLAVVSTLWVEATAGMVVLWIVYAALAAVISTLLVGLAAMHSGWFPGFAITVIFLSLGLFMRIPPVPLALLTGFVACTGPVFADMGYDLKAGWMLRGRGKDVLYEKAGRKQQLFAELLGLLVAMVIVGIFMWMHFELDEVPPISRVFSDTVFAAAEPAMAREMALWAIPGIILQAVGGVRRMMGVLFATGLLIHNPIYGIGIVLAVIVRMIIGTEPMEVREAGLIAGDGIYGFISGAIRALF